MSRSTKLCNKRGFHGNKHSKIAQKIRNISGDSETSESRPRLKSELKPSLGLICLLHQEEKLFRHH